MSSCLAFVLFLVFSVVYLLFEVCKNLVGTLTVLVLHFFSLVYPFQETCQSSEEIKHIFRLEFYKRSNVNGKVNGARTVKQRQRERKI